eukprot:2908037-Karenia_brevis.AAC.1
MYIAGNWNTQGKIKHTAFPTYTGSIKSDVMGLIDLDAIGDLPTIHQSKAKEYYGKRYTLAGGRAPDN